VFDTILIVIFMFRIFSESKMHRRFEKIRSKIDSRDISPSRRRLSSSLPGVGSSVNVYVSAWSACPFSVCPYVCFFFLTLLLFQSYNLHREQESVSLFVTLLLLQSYNLHREQESGLQQIYEYQLEINWRKNCLN
jgi:hypothetical protein